MNGLRLTPTIKNLLIAIFAAFVVERTVDLYMGGNLLDWLALVPRAAVQEFKIWQLVTYAFLHADVTHLFLNLLLLVFIGTELESLWGRRRFLRYFFFCVIMGGLAYLVMTAFSFKHLGTPMVGASAGIYGLLVAYGIIFSERVLLFMMLFPMKAKHFVWVLALVEFMTSFFSPGGGLSSVAHLGGMVGGIAYLWGFAWFARKRRQRESAAQSAKPSQQRRHLKLVSGGDRDDDSRGDGGAGSSQGPKFWH